MREKTLGRKPQRNLFLGALGAILAISLKKFTVGEFALYLGISLQEAIKLLDQLSRILPLTVLDGEDRLGFVGTMWVYLG